MKRRRAVLVQANRPTLFELDLSLTRAGRLLPDLALILADFSPKRARNLQSSRFLCSEIGVISMP
jgi:hypothetical protein